jgi:hypothetical protein
MGRKGAAGARLERLATFAKRLVGEFIGRHCTGKAFDGIAFVKKFLIYQTLGSSFCKFAFLLQHRNFAGLR